MTDLEAREWLAQTLGFDLPLASGSSPDSRPPEAQWSEARAGLLAADAQAQSGIASIRRSMREDDQFMSLADFLLDGSDRAFQDLVQALPTGVQDVRRDQVESALGTFQEVLDADEVVTACEDNPLGVAVSIRRRYGVAVAGVRRALGSV